MSRAIDAEALTRRMCELCNQYYSDDPCEPSDCIFAWAVKEAPTLTPQNEPLTLVSMSDELPPDNERVLVYRPCMVDSDTGPYSVQWGWAARRDGSHWAHLPDRRPPERQEDAK